MPSALREQYLLDMPAYADLLLSPRAHQRDGKLMSCLTCYKNIMNENIVKPPRFAISNGWAIGQLPSSFDPENIGEVLAALLARVRIFGNVFSYSGGAHKAISGHHTFFTNNPEQVGASFNYLMDSSCPNDVFVMICG